MRIKKLLRKWLHRLAWFFVLLTLIWLNYQRFNHNNYANYEKAVDYGRVREYKEKIDPVIAAVFYQNEVSPKISLSSYLNHWNSNIKNVKMVIVPKDLDGENLSVIEKIYAEIKRRNQIKYIALVYDESRDIHEHQELLNSIFTGSEIDVFPLNEQITDTEFDIQDYLNDINTMVVFAADLSRKFPTRSSNFLVNEAVYFAQKNAYKLKIFDEVDTQLARALEDDYAGWFDDAEKGLLDREKNNLKLYKEHYQGEILEYFAKNLNLEKKAEAIWPEKNSKTYRLYDRGMVYIRFFGEGEKEIFSRAKIGKNKGIIVAVIELARKAADKILQPIKKTRIYLLTDLEKIEKDANVPLVNYLETDDGVYVQYQRHNVLLAADERPATEKELMEVLRLRGRIAEDAPLSQVEFYRFKTVEIDYEN